MTASLDSSERKTQTQQDMARVHALLPGNEQLLCWFQESCTHTAVTGVRISRQLQFKEHLGRCQAGSLLGSACAHLPVCACA
jgi:hypothetical protein